MARMAIIAKELGLPIEERAHQHVCIPFLGIKLDIIAMEMRLPQNKLSQLKSVLEDWKGKKQFKKETSYFS